MSSAALQPLYKAVCCRCAFEGAPRGPGCPVCRFPVILEAESTPPGGQRLDQIFPRRARGSGAPRLPGVDSPLPPVAARPQAQPEIPPPPVSAGRWWRAISIGLVCVAAIAAGVVAAALTQSFGP